MHIVALLVYPASAVEAGNIAMHTLSEMPHCPHSAWARPGSAAY